MLDMKYYSMQSKNILASICSEVINRFEENKMDIFSRYFMDEGQDNSIYCFARKLNDPHLPPL